MQLFSTLMAESFLAVCSEKAQIGQKIWLNIVVARELPPAAFARKRRDQDAYFA